MPLSLSLVKLWSCCLCSGAGPDGLGPITAFLPFSSIYHSYFHRTHTGSISLKLFCNTFKTHLAKTYHSEKILHTSSLNQLSLSKYVRGAHPTCLQLCTERILWIHNCSTAGGLQRFSQNFSYVYYARK